jgi:hypothetical protein
MLLTGLLFYTDAISAEIERSPSLFINCNEDAPRPWLDRLRKTVAVINSLIIMPDWYNPDKCKEKSKINF